MFEKLIVVLCVVVVGSWSVASVEASPVIARYTVPADRAWHSFHLDAFPGWSLRAKLTPYQTALLSIDLIDSQGSILASRLVQPGRISSRRPRPFIQLETPQHHVDPFQLRIDSFRPRRDIQFDLYLPRLGYCRPLRSLDEEIGGLDYVDEGARVAGALIDPVVAIEGHEGYDSLAWGDGRFVIRRFLTRREETISTSGYVAIDREQGSWSTLYAGKVDVNSRQAAGRLFAGRLLALSMFDNEVPTLVRFDESGWQSVAIPRDKLKDDLTKIWEGTTPDRTLERYFSLASAKIRPSALGELLTLTFRVPSKDGSTYLARFHLRGNEVVHQSSRKLSPREVYSMELRP